MHASSKPTIYTEFMSARVSPATAAAGLEASKKAGVKPGVWVRMVIERALKHESDNRTVLAEVLALRTALLTLQMEQWRGKSFTDGQLTEMVNAADARKFAQADARILAAKSQ
jgi:hypothetical protein